MGDYRIAINWVINNNLDSEIDGREKVFASTASFMLKPFCDNFIKGGVVLLCVVVNDFNCSFFGHAALGIVAVQGFFDGFFFAEIDLDNIAHGRFPCYWSGLIALPCEQYVPNKHTSQEKDCKLFVNSLA
jgi:hypothetical protein